MVPLGRLPSGGLLGFLGFPVLDPAPLHSAPVEVRHLVPLDLPGQPPLPWFSYFWVVLLWGHEDVHPAPGVALWASLPPSFFLIFGVVPGSPGSALEGGSGPNPPSVQEVHTGIVG